MSTRSWTLMAMLIALIQPVGTPRADESSPVRLELKPAQTLLPAGTKTKSYLKIGLKGIEIPVAKRRPPINVALVLDRSGSMSGQKLAQAKDAAILALDYLQKEDSLSVVIYDHEVEVVIPAGPFTDRPKVEAVIRSIQSNGNTALYGGVSKGAEELRKYAQTHGINRLILLSDGLANVGPSTPAELGELGRKLGGERMSVTTIGLGLGYNEDLMVRLADASDGNHVFAETPSELAEVFRREFGELVSAVASDVVIIIQCQNGVKPMRALGRDAEINGDQVKARLNQLYASQEKYLLLELQIPEGQQGTELDMGTVRLQYQNLQSGVAEEQSESIKLAYSDSKDQAEASINKEVMVAATEQIGAEMDEEAVSMKDKGDTAAAGALLKKKSEYLRNQGERYGSEKLLQQSKRSEESERAVAAPASADAWNKARKEIRADQYSIKKQQSYK